MKTINEQIKKNELKHCYLLYGEEAYLRHQYRDKLCAAICPDGDDMNITRFVGKGISGTEVADIAETLPFFTDRRVIIIEDSGWFKQGADGFEDTECALALTPEEAKRYRVQPYIDNMGDMLAAADLVLSRSGASSVAEIAALAVPSVLVPYPHATADHQTTNARYLVDAGAGVLCADADIDGSAFADELLHLVDDAAARDAMRQAARGLAQDRAAALLADAVEGLR